MWKNRSEWLFYVVYLFVFGLAVLSAGILHRKSRQVRGRKDLWLPALPFLAGVLYFLLYPLQLEPRFWGCRVWNISEVLVFCVTGVLEGFIQTGLIPANSDYKELFSMMDFPARILDGNGAVKYLSRTAWEPFTATKNEAVMRHPVPGGEIQWMQDISEIRRLNQELEETVARIAERNAYLAQEAKVREERSMVETRNRIYERIMRIVRPQLDLVDGFLKGSNEDLAGRLPAIAVICAYIKRRSNMELLASENGLPCQELMLAVRESLDYLQLAGIQTALFFGGEEEFSRDVIPAYEKIEQVIEISQESVSDLMISIRAGGGTLAVRMLMKAGGRDALVEKLRQGGLSPVVPEPEGPDVLTVFAFPEGQ